MSEYKVDVPEGQSGEWVISRFTVSAEDSKRTELSAMLSGRGYVPSGEYTKLVNRYGIMMSDTPDEIWDNLEFIHQAKGHVLVTGLGLGVVIQALLRKDGVESVTVIEKSDDVIFLVEDHYQKLASELGKEFIVLEGDCFEFDVGELPREKYDYIWHDVWQDLCSDNLEEMGILKRKYKKFVNEAKNQQCWGFYLLMRHVR
jgi:hypothetical protein